MVAYTTTYNLKKPTVADDEDVWGGYLNDSMDLIDDVLDGTTPVTGIDINSGTIGNVTIDGDLSFADDTKAIFGAGSDLQIYHDGSRSIIQDNGTGNLRIQANNLELNNADNSENYLFAANNGAVTLYYDNAEKLATTSTGVDITGNIAVSGTVDGRDVAADGTKLDGIESGATADQTKSDIDALGIAASTAATLATARNIALSGDVSGSANFDGSANISITATVADDSHNHVISNVDGLQTALDGKLSTTGTAANSQLLDSLDSSQFLRSDAADSTSSTISFTGDIEVGDKITHYNNTNTYIQFGLGTISLYAGNDREITVSNTGVRLGDTGNGFFQPVSGDYGSIQIDGGAHSSYEGYSIGGRVVFMHDNGSISGIYNDVDNEWMAIFRHNAGVELYYNGTEKFATVSDGAIAKGNLYTNGSVAEDWDSLSGTSPTCNVDNGGAFSLTMTGNTTFTFSGAASDWSQGFILQLTGNGSTVTWPSSVDWAGGTAPDAPASGETDIYVFWTRNGGTTWYGVQSIDAAA